MHKKLFKCGNGMALIIDAHLRRLLGIDEHSLLHVVREGRRIVIEKSACDQAPSVEPVIATSSTYNPRLLGKLLMELDRAGLDRARFRLLRNGDTELFSFHAGIKFNEPADALTIARLQACHTKLAYGLSLDTAIAEVVAEIQCAPGNPMLTAARP